MPQSSGIPLVDRIERLTVPHGQLALWALGQAGFILKGGPTIVCIDPYLSDSITELEGPKRRVPLPLAPGALRTADLVFATHEHLDHADARTLGPLMAASSQARLITSLQGRDVARGAGVSDERITVPRLGERVTAGALSYTAIPAAHYDFEVDEAGHSRWMGFVIELNGVTVYHAGDTLVFPELLAALAGRAIDLALLPINGRDDVRDQRGITGNLWPGEAIALATTIGAQVLIGMHNDMFAENRVDPSLLFSELDRSAPLQRCHMLQPGELYLYAG